MIRWSPISSVPPWSTLMALPVPILPVPVNCPCLTIVTPFELKFDVFKGLVLAGEIQPVGEEACAAVESALGCDSSEFRKIIAFREMRKDDVGCLAVVFILEELGGGLVGEMPNSGKHSLLYRPGVGAVAEHFEVMV